MTRWWRKPTPATRENDYLTTEAIVADILLLACRMRGQCHRRPHQR
jgi:hypothetical protein